MSKGSEQEDHNTMSINDTPGFRSALYIQVPEFDNKLKEIKDGLDALKMGNNDYSDMTTPIVTPRPSDPKGLDFYKNCISSDLLKRLEENSPIKSLKNKELDRRLSDLCFQNMDKADEKEELKLKLMKSTSRENIQQENILEKTLSIINLKNACESEEPEKKELTQENVIGNMDGFRTRNFKLKTNVMQKCVNNAESPEEEQLETSSEMQNIKFLEQQNINSKSHAKKNSNLLSNNQGESLHNYQNNNIMPGSLFTNTNLKDISTSNKTSPVYKPKHANHTRKDSSPIYSYYDGTTEYLSQSFYNEFNRLGNEQRPGNLQPNTNNFIKKGNNINCHNIPNMNENFFNEEQPENNMNINSSLCSNNMNYYMNMNPFSMGMNNMNGVQMNSMNNAFSGQGMPNHNPMNPMMHPRMFMGDQNFNESPYDTGMNNMNNIPNMNPNFMNFQQHNPQNKNMYLNNPTMTNQHQSPQQLNNSMIQDNSEDYIVEMFGKRGWICDKCNNFNYETRVKCNRCGINKSPKRNIKLKSKPQEENDSLEDANSSFDRKKKKPFSERVGDWVCIKCKNLNFAFRVICNRCQLPKMESEKMFEQYMSNLMNYVKINEMMQNQVMQQTNPGQVNSPTGNLINNNNININNNFYNGNIANSNPNPPRIQTKNNKTFVNNNNNNLNYPFGMSQMSSGIGSSNYVSESCNFEGDECEQEYQDDQTYL